MRPVLFQQTSFFLPLFIFLFFLFVPTNIIASTTFTTSELYTVESAPVEPVSIDKVNNQTYIPPISKLKTHDQLLKENQEAPTFISEVQKQFVNFFKQLYTIGDNIFTLSTILINRFMQTLAKFIEEDGVHAYFSFGVFSSFAIFSFYTPLNPFVLPIIQSVFKSGIDLELRALIFIAAVLSSYSTQESIISTYINQVSMFQQTAHWDVGPFAPDAFLIGGILLIMIVLTSGALLLTVVKTTIIPLLGLLPSVKKIVNYIAGETKDAFIETEKECNERVDKCANLFDKATILFFNYLPDKMPDLGMDDVIINTKNNLLTPTPTPKS